MRILNRWGRLVDPNQFSGLLLIDETEITLKDLDLRQLSNIDYCVLCHCVGGLTVRCFTCELV